MKLERLLKMDAAELAERARQETSKWWERVTTNGKVNGKPHVVFQEIMAAPSFDEVPFHIRKGDLCGAARIVHERLRESALGRFFEGADSEQVPVTLARQRPELCDEIIRGADEIRRGHFDLLGRYGLCFGHPVDWHFDPISGRKSPLIHWSKIDPLDAEALGDSKVIWELNRHQWLVYLGQAYRFTGDERYAETFAHCVREWMRENPPGMGINWASSLEVALRLISWCWALCLFQKSSELLPELFVSVLGEIRSHAAHVEKYLSYYFSPNTHLTGEALGLFYSGVLFPELRSAGRWRELGAQILVEQSEKQILPDGVYFEQSTCYQRYTVEIYLHFLILARRNGVAIPPAIEERVQKMIDFLLAVRRPDGSMPQIGDADGGCLLPLAKRGPDDFSGLFSTAAALFGRPDYAWAAGELQPETLWLLGEAALEAFQSLRTTPPAAEPSRLFPEGGYAVMRSSWDADAHHLIFDVGPLGCPVSSGHGHADLLSIQCAVFGEPYLVDAGTYGYTADLHWRNFFRSADAHSTVIVDGVSQAVPAGAFAWRDRPGVRLRGWISNELYDLADGEHYAYRSLSDPVTHRRRVLFIKPRYWIVIDDLQGKAEHRVELRFQFAPMEVMQEPELWARALGSNGHGLLIKPFAPVPVQVGIQSGEVFPIEGWVSRDYGQRQPAPLLVYTAKAEFPLRIVTLLLPLEDSSVSVPEVSLLVNDDLVPVGIVFERGESMWFEDQGIFVEGQ